MERTRLDAGYDICPILTGGWQLAADHGAIAGGSPLTSLEQLVDAGFDTFDCADIYTGVEEILGRLRRARPAIRVHTKLVPDLSELPSLRRRDVEAAIDRSLQRLDAPQLDLVQLHWWDFDIPGYVEVAGWLAELQAAGKIRLVGLTNFDVPRLLEVIRAGVSIATHQVQYSLLDRRPENGMVATCRGHGIQLLCYGALAGGFLSDRYLGAAAPEPPHANRSLTKYRLIVDEAGGWEALQSRLRVLREIGDRHAVSIAAVAARWVLDRPGVGGVILGASSADHIAENLRTLELELRSGDVRELAELVEETPGPAGDIYALERASGGPHEAILRKNLRHDPDPPPPHFKQEG